MTELDPFTLLAIGLAFLFLLRLRAAERPPRRRRAMHW